MKYSILFITAAFFLSSCDKNESFSQFNSAISFEVSDRILDGEKVGCVDFDSDGNAWIAVGSSLHFYDGKLSGTYEVNSEIWDISVGTDGKVWVATKDRGLALLSDGKFTYYTKENSGLPRDLIGTVEAAPDGSVWFSSSAHDLGGLMHYDGNDFELFTPENSILNQHVISDLKIDRQGNVFFTSTGKVTQAKVFMIDKRRRMTALGDDTKFYWIGSFDVNSQSEAVVVDDYSLSSSSFYNNTVFIYRNGEWDKLEPDFSVDYINRMFVDKRDFIWVQGSIKSDYRSYFVFDGDEWHRSPKDMFSDAFIYSVKVDPHNNIWFCTNDGIYILNQS